MQTREPDCFISTSSGDAKTVQLLNDVFRDAARRGASDVHIESTDEGAVIRARLDGHMRHVIDLTAAQFADVERKIRMKASLSPSERKPLDGRIFIGVDGRTVDMRVSLLPIRTGMSIVLRLLDQGNATRRVEDIDMSPDCRQVVDETLLEPNGLFLVSGPTGSGKTSTLYAMLNRLNTPERKIITVEDPVEYRLAGACQVNVERPKIGPSGVASDKGTTFATALRAILRQDPDVILIGEIRDAETARIAVESALTGHMVLSTIHANDAPSTLTRLLDLGVDAFTLGAALRAVVAQRLVSRVCDCHDLVHLDAHTARWLGRVGAGVASGTMFPHPKGCSRCAGTGFHGRVPVLEILKSDVHVREAVATRELPAIQNAAQRQAQYESLLQAGVRLCVERKTALSQVYRLIHSEDADGDDSLEEDGLHQGETSA